MTDLIVRPETLPESQPGERPDNRPDRPAALDTVVPLADTLAERLITTQAP